MVDPWLPGDDSPLGAIKRVLNPILYSIYIMWSGSDEWQLQTELTDDNGISQYRRQEWHEKQSVEIYTTEGSMFLNRIDFKGIRFIRATE